MMEHNMEQYIREIVDDQIQWHDKKAIENQTELQKVSNAQVHWNTSSIIEAIRTYSN